MDGNSFANLLKEKEEEKARKKELEDKERHAMDALTNAENMFRAENYPYSLEAINVALELANGVEGDNAKKIAASALSLCGELNLI